MNEKRDLDDRLKDQQGEVPGVRTPVSPAGTQPDPKGEDTPGLEQDAQPPVWGGEGGAGTYPGGPNISDEDEIRPVTEPRGP